MKAWVITNYGGPEVLEPMEIEKPQPAAGKMLIEVHYVALNPYDYKLRNGAAKMMMGNKFPKVLGGDFSGKIIAVNDDESNFKPGQMVYGFANIFMKEQGCLAEYISIAPKYVRLLPSEINEIDASAVTSAGLTALSGISKCGGLSDKRVLVNGATGGVGHLATKFLIAKGAIVTAVCSTKNIEVAEAMNVARVIDYRKEEVLKDGEMYDVVFDAAAKFSFSQAKAKLNTSGIYCSTEESIKAFLASMISKIGAAKKMYLSGFRGSQEDFDEMETLMINNGVKPIINHTFSFSEVDKAFQLLEAGGTNGKIVIKVKDNE